MAVGNSDGDVAISTTCGPRDAFLGGYGSQVGQHPTAVVFAPDHYCRARLVSGHQRRPVPRDGFRPIVDSDAVKSGGGNLAINTVPEATTDVKPGLSGRVVGERGNHDQRLARFGHRMVRLAGKIDRSLSGWCHGMVGLAGKINQRQSHRDTSHHRHHCSRRSDPASAGGNRRRIRFGWRYGRWAGGRFRDQCFGWRRFRLEIRRDQQLVPFLRRGASAPRHNGGHPRGSAAWR